LRLVLTDRFGICLDERHYPFAELKRSACPFLDYVSNYGSDKHWPTGFQADRTGKCELRDRDWHVSVEAVTYEQAHPKSSG
jgi:hypothetical protein